MPPTSANIRHAGDVVRCVDRQLVGPPDMNRGERARVAVIEDAVAVTLRGDYREALL